MNEWSPKLKQPSALPTTKVSRITLRATALFATLVGAAGSFGFMLYTGRRNESIVLLVLFAVWVLAPFVGLLLAFAISKRRSVPTPAMIYWLMLILSSASLAVYGYVALGPPRAQPAFAFLVVPPASWLLIAIVGLLSARR